MAKKKKTQLKPVARGFATTSVPKKVIEDITPAKDVLSFPIPVATGEFSSAGASPLPSLTSLPKEDEDYDSDAVNEQSLQNLVDRFQERTEREITRTIKSLEVDRRFSQGLPRFDIDPVLRDKILESACDIGSDLENKGISYERLSEEKLLSRLGITYGVLRRLGFHDHRIEECLGVVNSFDLDDAFDWLYLHCREEELMSSSEATNMLSTTSGVTKVGHLTPPPTPRPLAANVGGASQTQMKAKGHPTKSSAIEGPDDLSSLKSQILSSLSVGTDSGASGLDPSQIDDPTVTYVQLKLRLDDLTAKSSIPKQGLDPKEELALRQLLDDLSHDHLFDERESQRRYKIERQRADAEALRRKLCSPPQLSVPQPLPSANKVEHDKKQLLPQATVGTSTDIFEDPDSEDFSEGLLGLLEDVVSGEVLEQGVSLRLRPMALPKNWSGPMPKTLLRDLVSKMDRYAAIFHTIVSVHSRARRANVTIVWHNGTKHGWTMDDVACPEESQAEQYISTVALHSLIYPVTTGFASSAPASSASHTSFRLLPATYRDLWDELECTRKSRNDMVNRNTWAKLRSIVEVKLEQNLQQPGIDHKHDAGSLPPKSIRYRPDNSIPEPLAAAFRARQATPAYQAVLAQRNELPIAQYRSAIIRSLEESQVLVLSGETGCGKSTQLPAFILEDHLARGKPCRIYCTEPRRISAISLAQRVAFELCDPPTAIGASSPLVGYSIRLESTVSRHTRLAFVTNGIALRMLEGGSSQGGQGVAFDEITHIIIDEVHERTIESDFLLIVLKSLLQERPDLKVVLMSATLDADKISNYFGNCKTLHVPGRTFPVDVRYLEDAVEVTGWTVSEDSPYARRMHDKYYKGKIRAEWTEDSQVIEDEENDEGERQTSVVQLGRRYSPETAATLNNIDERLVPYDLIIRLLETICYQNQKYVPFSSAVLVFMPGLGEIRRLNDLLMEHPVFGLEEFRIFPLHSTISSESQGAVFEIPPRGIRKIVIATNIAETGITIPDVTCVIDTGKHREMRFDEKRQISRLVETFIAKSNAAQRKGRAGRVQPGLCFHLFTKVHFDTQLAESPLPEMMRLSLSDLALRIKIMKVKLGSSIEDVLSRAMDPPIAINVQRAVSMLVEVRALTPSEDITAMGKLLSKLPTDVHLGKFLLIATTFRCLDPALTVAAALNSKSPFVAPFGLENEAERAKNSFRIENSDFLTIHNAFSSWRKACANPGFARKFCRTNFLSHQNLQQIEDLRQQFLGYLIDSSFIKADASLVRELSRARFSRNRARFVTVPPDLDANSANVYLVQAALAAGLYPKILSVDSKNGQMRTVMNNQAVAFHPSSVNFGKNALEFSANYLSYFTIMHSKKLYAWETGPVDDLALLLLCGDCEFKLRAETTSIDRKIKLSVPPKTSIALKILRTQLSGALAQLYLGKSLTQMQERWMNIGLLALGRSKVIEDTGEHSFSMVKT